MFNGSILIFDLVVAKFNIEYFMETENCLGGDRNGLGEKSCK